MRNLRTLKPMIVLSSLLLACSMGIAQANVNEADRDLVKQVSERLVGVTAPVPDFVWPPRFEIVDDRELQALAIDRRGPKDDKVRPVVEISSGLLTEVIQGDADRLALILGHELGHVVLRHISSPGIGRTPFVRQVIDRQMEIDADQKGMELALQAGYSRLRGLKAYRRMIDLGLENAPIEIWVKGGDHPSWKERLARIDKDQAPLWKAMAAFHSGTYFLLSEQYDSAEACFREVTREFPGCHEAWANLGYTLLMKYCDKLDTDDLRRFDLGQIVVGAFDRVPESLRAQVRGIDAELWWDVVGALREALRLKPDSILAQCNLGVAYLVSPEGKDAGKAARYLSQAAAAAEADKDMDPLLRATVLINAGVADLAGGHPESTHRIFQRVEQDTSRFPGWVSGALHYNRALLLSGSTDPSDRRAALGHLEAYLRSSSQTNAWWPLAYNHYLQVCQALHQAPKSKDELRKQALLKLRPLSTVELPPEKKVSLTERMVVVQGRLGDTRPVPVVARTNLARLPYPDLGVELLGTDQVLAICLRGPKAPAISLQGTGMATQRMSLRIGMKQKELDDMLIDAAYPVFRELDVPGVAYRFYRDLGLAVRVRNSVVEELVVVQLPDSK
jgi:tetratricopeptide (TPR) repeat protein